MEHYYKLLGVQKDATLEEIKKAYRKYATKYHPDKHNGDDFFKERFQEIKEAYEYIIYNFNCIEYKLPPVIHYFKLSSLEIMKGSEIELNWNVSDVSILRLEIKTSHGMQKFDDLKFDGKCILSLDSDDNSVGLSLIAQNNVGEVCSDKLIKLKLPANDFQDSKSFKAYNYFIFWTMIIASLGIVIIFFLDLLKII